LAEFTVHSDHLHGYRAVLDHRLGHGIAQTTADLVFLDGEDGPALTGSGSDQLLVHRVHR
jgi:Zn-dependent metalloprotease